jgi:hypothetical protein
MDHLSAVADNAAPNYRNLTGQRYAIEQNVGPDPPGSSGCFREGFSFFDDVRREEEFRDDPEVFHLTFVAVVL